MWRKCQTTLVVLAALVIVAQVFYLASQVSQEPIVGHTASVQRSPVRERKVRAVDKPLNASLYKQFNDLPQGSVCRQRYATDPLLWTKTAHWVCGPDYDVKGYEWWESQTTMAEVTGIFCLHEEKLPTSSCLARNIVVEPKLITVSKGGEPIASVLGRAEDAEYPKYGLGAFRMAGCKTTMLPPQKTHLRAHLQDMMHALETPQEVACTVWEERKAFFVTRYEYANLYHTMTDWFMTWQIMQMRRVFEGENILVVFFDGHAEGILDTPWKTIFGADVRRISEYNTTTCFREAVFVPPGYASPLNQEYGERSVCPVIPSVTLFADSVLEAYGINTNQRSASPAAAAAVGKPLWFAAEGPRPRVTVIVRRDYLAHPRNAGGQASRKFANEEEIERALVETNLYDVRVVNLVELEFGDQVRLAYNTDVLIGIHGAGLSHILFTAPGAALIEIVQPPNNHFQNFCAWIGRKCFALHDGFKVNPQALLREVKNAVAAVRDQHPKWRL